MASEQVVLIVDDNRLLREQYATALRSAGYTVVTAADGQEAVAAAQRGRPDAVLMDVMMPVMGGIAALTALLALYPDLPVIMITADESAAIEREALEAGARQVLYKPVPLADLVARFTRCLA